jgi:sulfite reductase (NADPH) flavoprotein alpha-component
MGFTADPLRLAVALALLLAYAGLCGWAWRHQQHLRRRHPALADGRADARSTAAPWLVAHASQTGHAEELAARVAQALSDAGHPVRLCRLGDVDAATLQQARHALFVASTSGEGDAPDAAAAFVAQWLTRALPLPGLRFGLLALGDRSYAQFCAFGRRLDARLLAQGATPLFPRIDVDRGSLQDLASWQAQLAPWCGPGASAALAGATWSPWRLARRELLNAGSAGAPLYLLALQPAAGSLPAWQSGDLVEIAPPADAARPRDYSIASVPADGRIELMVRLRADAGAPAGVCSSWLTQQAAIGCEVPPELDLAFSRDGAPWPYVQDRLRARADALRQWVADGAALYVCGSRAGMGLQVDATLQQILGPAALATLAAAGRYRRDLY